MLQTETVTPGTLGLLKELMQDENLGQFFLVVGTALSLQIGHRASIGLDLFSQNPFDENKMLGYLESQRGLRLNFLDKNTIKGQIKNVQVDLTTHAYPLVNAIVLSENIRLASLEDIAAMKLNAITGNGTRLKDFVGIAFLSSYLTLEQMVSAYQKKYQTRNPFIPLKALVNHNEINFKEPLNFISGSYKWKLVERRLNSMAKSPHKLFEPLVQSSPAEQKKEPEWKNSVKPNKK